MTDDRVQVQRTVGLVTVQVDRHAGDRDMGHDQRVHDHLPDRQVEQTAVQGGQDGMQHATKKIH